MEEANSTEFDSVDVFHACNANSFFVFPFSLNGKKKSVLFSSYLFFILFIVDVFSST